MLRAACLDHDRPGGVRATTRMIGRLARHGLVERYGCDVDRRGVYVVLTEAGERSRRGDADPSECPRPPAACLNAQRGQ